MPMTLLLDSVVGEIAPVYFGLTAFRDGAIDHRCIPTPPLGGPTYTQAARIFPVTRAGFIMPNQGDLVVHLVCIPKVLNGYMRGTMAVQFFFRGQWVTQMMINTPAQSNAYAGGDVASIAAPPAFSTALRRVPVGAPVRFVVWSNMASGFSTDAKLTLLHVDLWLSNGVGHPNPQRVVSSAADMDTLGLDHGVTYVDNIPVQFA